MLMPMSTWNPEHAGLLLGNLEQATERTMMALGAFANADDETVEDAKDALMEAMTDASYAAVALQAYCRPVVRPLSR